MYRLTVRQQGFKEKFAVIKAEADGKRLNAEIRRELRTIMEPAAAEARSAILGMQSAGLPHKDGIELRSAIAGGVKVGINASGRLTGVRIYVSKRGMPRNFANAPRDTNRPGWLVRGRVQVGLPGWFDKALKPARVKSRAAVEAAMNRMIERIKTR